MAPFPSRDRGLGGAERGREPGLGEAGLAADVPNQVADCALVQSEALGADHAGIIAETLWPYRLPGAGHALDPVDEAALEHVGLAGDLDVGETPQQLFEH